MNTSILKKCLDELNKENPRKDYVIGMIETLIDTQGANQVRDLPYLPPTAVPVPYFPNSGGSGLVDLSPISDEQSNLARAYGSGPIGTVSNS